MGETQPIPPLGGSLARLALHFFWEKPGRPSLQMRYRRRSSITPAAANIVKLIGSGIPFTWFGKFGMKPSVWLASRMGVKTPVLRSRDYTPLLPDTPRP